jgi:TRAP transporter TAXI family solute receptor
LFTPIALLLLLLCGSTGCDKLKTVQKLAANGASDEEGGGEERPKILTGSKKGNYYKAAKELNDVLGDDLALDVRESKGSYDNLEELGNEKADYAIAQFDTLIMFLRMDAPYPKLANNCLAMAPLSNEVVHVLVRKGAGIRTLADLKNKRIAAGSARSGSFVSAFTLMVYFNDVNLQRYRNTFNEPYEESLEKLENGKLDALFITSSLGMPLLSKLPASLGEHVELLDVGGNVELPKPIAHVYAVEPVPAGTYPWQKTKVHALATPGYLFAYHGLSSSDTRKVAKAIYEKAGKLRKKSDLWSLVSKERAKQDMGFGIGFHAGVKAYFATGK